MINKYLKPKKLKYLFILFFITFSQVIQAQELSITPSPIDFGNVVNGNFMSLDFTLTNNSATESYTIDPSNGFVLTGTNADQFNENNNPPPFISPGESFEGFFSVLFQPTSEGLKNAVLEIHTDAPDSPVTVNLSGNSIPFIPSDISYSFSSFPTIQYNETSTSTMTINSTGAGDLIISTLKFPSLETFFNYYSVESGISFPVTIPSGSSVSYDITFAPPNPPVDNRFSFPINLLLSSNANGIEEPSISATIFPPNIPNPSIDFNFNEVNVGETLTQDYTVTNSGQGILIINNIRKEPFATGPNATTDYVINNLPTFPLFLNNGESVTLNISFTPSVIESRNMNLIFDVNNYHSFTYGVQVFGGGKDVGFSSINTLSFPTTRVNNPATNNFTITNTGTSSLNISDGVISGADPSHFSISSANNPQSILGGNTATIEVTFNPTTVGTKNAILTFTSNDDNSPHTISLSGEAINSNLIVPTDITLQDVSIQSVSPNQTITLSNITGSDSVTITDISISGTSSSEFNLIGITLPIIINSGNETTFEVNFEPLTVGSKTAQINIISNDNNSPQAININATVLLPILDFGSDTLVFPDTASNAETTTASFTITNTGQGDLIINTLNITGTNASDFEIQGLSLPITIASLSNAAFNVDFSPTSGGTKTAQINFVSNDQNTPQTLNLTGNSLAPSLNLSSILLEFLDTEAGVQTRTKPFNIVNTGASDLIINDISIAGVNASEFILQGISLPITVAPLSSETIEVIFSPQSAGLKGAMLTVTSNFTGNVELPMLGTGNAPLLNASNLDFGDVISNRTKTEIITINNNGSSNLLITDINIDGTDADLFNFQTLSLPITLENGESTEIEVTFDPTTSTAGNKTANLTIVSNDLNSPTIAVLNANAIDLPEFSATNHLELPIIDLGESVNVDLVVSNTGTADLIIDGAFTAFGGTDSIFILSSNNNYPITIPAGSQGNLVITYIPQNADLQNARIFIHSNDINLPFVSGPFGGFRAEVLITGGVISPGFLVTNEDPIVFPDTSIGRSSTTTFEVMNTGNATLEFFNFFGANSGMFQIVDNNTTLARDVLPGETVEFTIKFIPTGIPEQKNGNITLNVNLAGPGFSFTEFLIPVSGLAGEPVDVDVNGMIFQADSKIVTGDIITLSGNVHIGNLEFSNDVIVNLITNEVTCDACEMFATNIPQIGDFGGDRVLLQSGDISTVVITSAGFPELDFTSFGTVTNGLFKMVGIPLEITKIKILADSEDDEDFESDGIEIGGKIGLPAEIFGDDSEIELETIRISTITGVDVVGSIEINPELNVLGIFELNSASVNFDTIENSFGGAAEIGFDLMGKGITVAAGFQIIRGSLDSVELEIEVDPGIPIANTGFLLAGGNGFINGLVEPPISIGLGVDIAPVAPLGEVLYFDNMTLSYTFGTSFNASGTIQLFREDVGGGGVSVFVNPNQQGVSLNVWANVFEIFEGEVDLLVENKIDEFGVDKLNVEMAAKLTVNIPEIPFENCPIGCQVVNGYLPIAIAEVDVTMDNTSMKAGVTIATIATINVEVETNAARTGSKFTMGGNIGPLTFSFRNAAQQRGITNLVFENDPIEMALDINEGRSLLIDANNPYRNNNSIVNVPFLLTQSYQNIFVRVKGNNGTPNYTLVLPDGTELTSGNAGDFNALATTYDLLNAAFFTLKDTQVGEYIIRLDDSDTYEIDVAGAEFAATISNVAISQNTLNDDITINWNDQDIDSDATVSFYYDTDNEGGNGLLIEDEISEDDATDQITWNANYLKNGTYYVYGKIDDGTNVPTILYANETFIINNESVVPSTTLVTETFIDTIVLSWSEIIGAAHYLVYIDENPITFMSPSQNVGQNTSFDFTEILPGRTYNFAVKVIFDDGTDLTESNFSNIETIAFISTTSNNIPKIETEELPVKNTPCDEYVTTIQVSDPDVSDVLTLTLLTFPEGMTLNGNTLNWFPNKDQLGKHQVIALVDDGNGGTDEKSFTITVFEIDDEIPTPNVENLSDVIAECSTTLTAPTASDNCSGELTATTDVTTFDTQGTFEITWTYDDGFGNVLEQIQNVTIQDTTAPNVQTNNIEVALDSNGNVNITIDQIDNNSTDECGIDTRILDVLTFDCTNLGENTVTLTVTDVNGLVATNTAIVTVVDNENPVAISHDITLELDENGEITLTADEVDNNSTDNCGIDTKSIDVSSFTCANIGVQNVVLTVTDVSGNESTSNAIITIEDNLNPIVNTNNITVQLDELGNASISTDDIDNNSTDNCGIDSRSLDLSNFTCNDIGENTVTLIVIDSNGNFASQEATVTVVDELAPEVTCLDDFSVDADVNNEFEMPDYLSSIIRTDNCSDESNITITQDVVAGTIVGLGETVITITATDEYNNESTCSFILTVNTTLGINDVNLEDNITLYPNPASNQITIDSNGIIISKVIIYDVLGKIVLSTTKKEIDISNLTTGSYFVRIIDNNGNNAVKKFIKK